MIDVVSGRLRQSRRTLAALTIAGSAVAAAVIGQPIAASATTVGVGLPPAAIALDGADHTAYVATSDSNDSQVAVIDTNLCSAVATTGCSSGAASTINLEDQASPSALAYDSANHTLYVTDAGTGNVSLIDTTTCNATVTSGCGDAPTVESFGLTSPGAIAVDTSGSGDTVYVADESSGSVTVFGGATCGASSTTGCATTEVATTGDAPSAIAVDPTAKTVYVSDAADDSVSLLSEAACSALTVACQTLAGTATLEAGAAPQGLAVLAGNDTLYVADSGTDDLAIIDTTTCNASSASGCSSPAQTVQAGSTPIAVTVEPSEYVAVADSGSNSVTSFDGRLCNGSAIEACTTTTTTSVPGGPAGLAATSSTLYTVAADSTHVDVAAASVQPTISATLTSKYPKTKYGYYRSPVTVSFTCSMGTGSIQGKCPPSQTVTQSGKGQVVTGDVEAADGGYDSVRVTINLDRVPPTVKVTGVKNGKTYRHQRTLHCVAHDSLSGVASCKISFIGGTHSKKHGKATEKVFYTATATDKAGNTATAKGRYQVKK